MQLYVAEFRNGVIKIGRTINPLGRETKMRFNGHRATRIHWCRAVACGALVESQLLRRVRRVACTVRGREWFVGIGFGAATHMADQQTARVRTV
jgi:hypothetical protein